MLDNFGVFQICFHLLKFTGFQTTWFEIYHQAEITCHSKLCLSLTAFYFILFIDLIYVYECTCLYVGLCTHVMQCRRGQKRATDSPGIGVMDSSQLPCGCWGLNPGPLQEQSVLLTVRLSLQPPPPSLIHPALPSISTSFQSPGVFR